MRPARWRVRWACCRSRGSMPRPSARAAEEIARLAAEDDGVSRLVVGLPRRLDGRPNDMTPRVEAFAAQLGARTGCRWRCRTSADERRSREPAGRPREGLARRARSASTRRPPPSSCRTISTGWPGDARLLLRLLLVLVVLVAVGGRGVPAATCCGRACTQPLQGLRGPSSSSRSRRAPARARSAAAWSMPASCPTRGRSARRCAGPARAQALKAGEYRFDRAGVAARRRRASSRAATSTRRRSRFPRG